MNRSSEARRELVERLTPARSTRCSRSQSCHGEQEPRRPEEQRGCERSGGGRRCESRAGRGLTRKRRGAMAADASADRGARVSTERGIRRSIEGDVGRREREGARAEWWFGARRQGTVGRPFRELERHPKRPASLSSLRTASPTLSLTWRALVHIFSSLVHVFRSLPGSALRLILAAQ